MCSKIIHIHVQMAYFKLIVLVQEEIALFSDKDIISSDEKHQLKTLFKFLISVKLAM